MYLKPKVVIACFTSHCFNPRFFLKKKHKNKIMDHGNESINCPNNYPASITQSQALNVRSTFN